MTVTLVLMAASVMALTAIARVVEVAGGVSGVSNGCGGGGFSAKGDEEELRKGKK